MSRRKLENKNIRKLIKLGTNSLVVSLPVDMIRQLKWREKQKVTVKKVGKKIIIEDWKK